MAPSRFGLFKTRSRDHQGHHDQPSTENLLQSSGSSDYVNANITSSPIPSTSKGHHEHSLSTDLAELNLDSDDDEIESETKAVRRLSDGSIIDDNQFKYQQHKDQISTDATSITSIHDEEYDRTYHSYDADGSEMSTAEMDPDRDGASTSCDANSIQFDEASLAVSEDFSLHCRTKKPKKYMLKEKQLLRDINMWHASNVEVMQNLLRRSGTQDDQMKWEAIATARGLCTLKDNCTCTDCLRTKYLAGLTDGDGGLGAAPLFSAMTVGCSVQ